MFSDNFFMFLLSGAVLFASTAIATHASSRDATGTLLLVAVLLAGSLLATAVTAKGVINFVYFNKGAGLLTVVLVFGISFLGFVLAKALNIRFMKAPALIFAMIGLLCIISLFKS